MGTTVSSLSFISAICGIFENCWHFFFLIIWHLFVCLWLTFTFLDGLSYERWVLTALLPEEPHLILEWRRSRKSATWALSVICNWTVVSSYLSKESQTRLVKLCILLPCTKICLVTIFRTRFTVIHLSTVSTDLSNLVPSALCLINPVETFTSVYNLYIVH